MKAYEIAARDVAVDKSQKLGEGGFGAVFKGKWQGTMVALKVLTCRLEGDLEAEFRHEMETMLDLRCPQLVRLFGAVMDGDTQVMVMELMPNGNLYSLLRKQNDLSWNTKYQIALDVAYGIKYLHDRDILHRDLKSMNVLLNKGWRAQIGDFGLVKVKTATKSFATTKESSVGTVLWMAPELFERKAKFSPASDIYALGMVLYEMLTHQIPFEADLEGRHPGDVIPKWLDKGERPDLPAAGEADYKKLIEACWTQVPSARPIAENIIARLEPLLSASSSGAEVNPCAASGGDAVMKSGPQYLAFSEAPGGAAAAPVRSAAKPQPKESRTPAARSPVKATEKQRLFKVALDPKEVEQFLSYVAEGDQDNAEAMLKTNPKLALGKGDCKDFGGRVFKNITGFQYALWALDWHMWEMILGYLEREDSEAARQQCREQEAMTQALGHGAHYNLGEIIDALNRYIDQYSSLSKAKKSDDIERLWIHGVGGAQKKTVAHVAQEYCHPDRPFNPVPDFTQKPFKRQFKTSPLASSGFAMLCGRLGATPSNGRADVCMWYVPDDRDALSKLHEVRTSQLKETQSYLLNHGARPGARS